MIDLEYEPVDPIGKETVYGHQHRADGNHVWGPFDVDKYPESREGKALRDLRVRLDLGWRDAARALHMSLLAYSALERGAAKCNWLVASEALCIYAQQLGRMARDPRGQVP